MPLFQYKIIGEDGKEHKGVLDADSLFMAKERLRKQKLLITSIQGISSSSSRTILNQSQLLSFTRELAQLLKAGLPLYESLVTIEEKHRQSKVHVLFADICDLIKNGSSFSNALSRYPETFHEIYLSMVKSAEQSGCLYDAFSQLTSLISKQQKLKKQLLASLAYPAFLGSFCLIVIGALFFFVIPSMKELFEGRSLHPLTSIVISISNFLQTQILWIASFLLLIVSALYALSRRKNFRIQMGLWLLEVPYIKKIIMQSALIRFFRAMYMLLNGGVTLVEALYFAKKVVSNSAFLALIEETSVQVVEGRKISQLFSEAHFIPPLVIRMLAIGEETGNMGLMMGNMAEIFEEELDRDLQQLATFLQPAVLLFLGVVVGVVVLSILLPLTDVSSFVSSG
jgi:general secretion pathway protein F/type IV pilus assembly protein PilC